MSKDLTMQMQHSTTTKVLHWLMAILMILMLLATFGFAQAITVDDKLQMLLGHSSMGIVVSLFLIWRVYNRFFSSQKTHFKAHASEQSLLPKIVHMTLYLLMLIIPTTGLLTARFHELPVMAFGLVDLSITGDNEQSFMFFRSLHESAISLFFVLLTLHIGAALYHSLIKRDGVFSRMWFGKKK